MQFKVVILVSFLCSLVAADSLLEKKDRAGGLLGFGLLGGDTTTAASSADTTTTTSADPTTTTSADPTTTPSADTTTTTASSGDTTTTAAADDLSGPIKSLIDLLTGVSTVLPVEDIANLMGINISPIPSPFSDPLGFVTHPLITPIILAAVTS